MGAFYEDYITRESMTGTGVDSFLGWNNRIRNYTVEREHDKHEA
jgi:hypothetical protein